MVNASKAATLHTMFFCTDQGKNTYSRASINKILELLSKHYNINIKRRWLFQCLRDLEDRGFLKRKRRYSRYPGGLIQGIPSLWSFTLKGLHWLFKRGVTPAAALYKKMLLWLQKKDGRFPKKEDFFGPGDPQEDREAVERLKQLAEAVTKDIK